jgi:DNA repair protein RadD
MTAPPPPLWPPQVRFIDQTVEAFQAGRRAVLSTMPTGLGKTRAVLEIINYYTEMGFHAAVYTDRRLLIDQLSGVLEGGGVQHGVRAAGHRNQRELPVQVCSLPTELRRTLPGAEYGGWTLHGLGHRGLAVLDEAHRHANPTGREIVRRHLAAGHLVLGVTATPIGLGEIYEELIVAGTTSDGRACGALVRCDHYAPDEPDLRGVKATKYGEDISQNELKKLFRMGAPLAGRVLENYRKLNPTDRPTILFASGVEESAWFAEQFSKAGIPAAHIDGADVWVGGTWYKSDRSARSEVLDGSRSNDIRVVCNRFVLREGVDCPWLAHGILATTFGSVQSYLQSGGRLLRAHDSLDQVTLQDHGGNWHRHGSLNADRAWHLDDTAASVRGEREERLREKKEAEPWTCPQCSAVTTGRVCQKCSFEVPAGRRCRMVVETDDRVKPVYGDVYPKRVVRLAPDTAKLWASIVWASRPTKNRPVGFAERTFRQARGYFYQQHGYFPDPSVPLMPTSPRDWDRLIDAVPLEQLTRKKEAS